MRNKMQLSNIDVITKYGVMRWKLFTPIPVVVHKQRTYRTEDELQLIKWCNENWCDDYYNQTAIFFFKNKNDALQFKLSWC